MLTKQDYGIQYSNKYLNEHSDLETEISMLSAFYHMGSDDSLFPKSLRYSIKSKAEGWDKEQTVRKIMCLNICPLHATGCKWNIE